MWAISDIETEISSSALENSVLSTQPPMKIDEMYSSIKAPLPGKPKYSKWGISMDGSKENTLVEELFYQDAFGGTVNLQGDVPLDVFSLFIDCELWIHPELDDSADDLKRGSVNKQSAQVPFGYSNTDHKALAFKTTECPEGANCSKPFCPKFHSLGERRYFNSIKKKFPNQICSDIKHCEDREKCEFSHSLVEYLHCAKIYKQGKCPLPWGDLGTCELGELCTFSHSNEAFEHNAMSFTLTEQVILMAHQLQNEQERVKKLILRQEEVVAQRKKAAARANCQSCRKNLNETFRVPCGHGICRTCNLTSPVICLICKRRGYSVPR